MDQKLELFAIVELFGHQQIAGAVTEQTVGSSTFVRITVPETKAQPTFDRLVNPSAIYAINPVTQEVMQLMAEKINQKPIESWDIRKMTEKLMLNAAEHRNYRVDDDNDS